MASAATVHVTPPTVGGFGLKTLSNDSASKASEVLQANHEKHHIYFNREGFHGTFEVVRQLRLMVIWPEPGTLKMLSSNYD